MRFIRETRDMYADKDGEDYDSSFVVTVDDGSAVVDGTNLTKMLVFS
jgi:hypothetical protein